MTQPQDQSLDFYRASLKATGDMIRISLESAERLRRQQLSTVGEALASHAKTVAEIDAAKGFAELAKVTAKLAGIQYQMMFSYWNGIHQMSAENQAEVARQVQAHAERLRQDVQKSLGAIPVDSAPIMAALQPLMEVASSAYMLTSRATEDMAKLAAQLAVANAGTRKAAGQAQRRSA